MQRFARKVVIILIPGIFPVALVSDTCRSGIARHRSNREAHFGELQAVGKGEKSRSTQ